MTPEQRILDSALTAVAGGVNDFLDLVDILVETTDMDERAAVAGLDPAEYLDELLDTTERIHVGEADKVIRMDLLMDGVVFTRRLTSDEIDGDLVHLLPDLAAVDLGADELEVQGGALSLQFEWDENPHVSEHGSLVGPGGWLAGFEVGQLVGFRRKGSKLVLERVEEPFPGHDEIDAIRHAFEVECPEGMAVEPLYLLEHALLEYPGIFRFPVPPVSELLTEADIEVVGAYVGRAGTDWMSPAVAYLENLDARLSREYELNACCEEALDDVRAAWGSHVNAEDIDTREVNRALAHGSVVAAFHDWIDDLIGVDKPSVGQFATVLASSGHRDIAPAMLLRAAHREALGDAPAAKTDLEASVRADPDFGPALAELAWYTSDEGDATRTVSLLRRAGLGEDDPILSFHAGLGTDLPEVGRNQPCPCGSGRKYKACHLGKTEVPPDQRSKWLLAKLTTFVARPNRRASLVGLASSAMLDDFEIEDLVRMAGDEFILDLRVFEGGGVSEFLDERGMLLPGDERDLLELWEMATLRLWEVVDTDHESTTTVRDTQTGDTLDVTDHSMAHRFRPGEQILARFLPGWGKTWASAVMVPVDLRHRDSLLKLLDHHPDADMIAEWYGSLHASPTLSNRESEPLVFCTARMLPTYGWEQLSNLLDDLYEPDDDEEMWRETVEIDEDEALIRANLRRDGDELVVETNSEVRLDRVVDQLGDSVEVVEQSARPARNLKEMQANLGDLPPTPPPPPLDPEVAEEIRDKMERRWLDEDIPALGGMTPRQAAADPTRREDLIDLLRSFERMPGSDLSQRPEVLRRHLGLEDE